MATFKAAAIFSDHMVLQRNKGVRIFGEGENGKKVTVRFNGQVVSASVVDEKWTVMLSPMAAAVDLTMKISDGESEITFSDIAVGEVWLAGGQSNMELELQNCENGWDELHKIEADPNCVNVRFYYTEKYPCVDDELTEKESHKCWSRPDKENSRYWSAVGYFFGKKLSEDLGVTVGVIGCNWGGTSASAWISKERLATDVDTNEYNLDYDKAMEGKTYEQYLEDLADYRRWEADWTPKMQKMYRDNPNTKWADVIATLGPNRYPEPLGPRSPFRAGGVYESMIQRVAPYTMAGAIYYQGESDDHRPEGYYKLMKMLIEQWRVDWKDDKLPIIMVQLPMYCNEGEDRRTNWCVVREAQARVFGTVKNTGLAVISEYGEHNNIHPVKKEPVGNRLAMQAEWVVYGTLSEGEACAPSFESCYAENGEIICKIAHCGSGLTVSGDVSEILCEIAGEDKKFVPVDKLTVRGSVLTASSEKVKEPCYLRYNWANWCSVQIFGGNGMPLMPFRTSMNDE